MKTQFNIRLPDEMKERIKERADRDGTNMAQVIFESITHYLKQTK